MPPENTRHIATLMFYCMSTPSHVHSVTVSLKYKSNMAIVLKYVTSSVLNIYTHGYFTFFLYTCVEQIVFTTTHLSSSK